MKNIYCLWLHGLAAASIGGAATGVATLLAQGTLDWKVIGKVAVIGALTTAVGYLKQSPLPAPPKDTK